MATGGAHESEKQGIEEVEPESERREAQGRGTHQWQVRKFSHGISSHTNRSWSGSKVKKTDAVLE
jgi:hypothetical protein